MKGDVANPGRSAVTRARDFWYVVCRSDELRHKPLPRTLFDTPLVLFRDDAGRAATLLDRCAHRNVPLSAGRVVGGQLECGYHGWRYDTGGICRLVPSLIGDAEGKARRVTSYPTREQQGFVWVFGNPEGTPTEEPYRIPHLEDSDYCAVRYDFRFACSLFSTLENILDVPHTAFLHRGLFRSSSQKNRITAVVRRAGRQVEAQYIGEPAPRGLIGKILAPGGGEVTHFDRFILPSVAQVEYSLGRSHVTVTDCLTPVGDFETELHSVVTVRLPVAGAVVTRVLTPLALRIAQQDAVMLALQTKTVQRFGGEQFVNTDVDVLGPHILRLLRQAERGELDPHAAPVEERVELMV
jgi:phenylpropionate dioxygenase-like ring-hydroxylating dioxygenase large terminal subunit